MRAILSQQQVRKKVITSHKISSICQRKALIMDTRPEDSNDSVASQRSRSKKVWSLTLSPIQIEFIRLSKQKIKVMVIVVESIHLKLIRKA